MRWLPCLAIIICAAALAAVEMTMVQGTVKFPDGAPCLNMVVTITVGETSYTVTTDRLGHFGKSVPTGPATIRVEGVTKTITLSEDWDKNTLDITLGGGQITQTIFGADGKPLPQAAVTITYIWNDTLYFRQATADAAGRIVWTEVPPVKAIVWGPKVPAGVLPVGATTITAPLPAPVPAEKHYLLDIDLPELPGPRGGIYWMVDPPGQAGIITTVADRMVRHADGKIHSNYNQYQIYGGTRINLVVLAAGDPVQIAALEDVYAPYDDGKDSINHLHLEWTAGIPVTLNLTVPAGAPAPALSGMRVLPEGLPGLPALFTRELKHLTGLMNLTPKGAGSWSVSLPAPGAYRVEGDLFRGGGLPFTVAARQSAVSVALPAPLITAPGGTDITYLRRDEPCTPRIVTIDPNAGVGALYGPPGALLASWYRPSPETLVWQAAGMAPQRAALRTVFLRFLGPDGKPLVLTTESREVRLSTLVPEARWSGRFVVSPGRSSLAAGTAPVADGNYETPAVTKAQVYPDGEVRAQVTAWSGRYRLTGFGSSTWSTTLELPAAGGNELPVTVDFDRAAAGLPAGKRTIHLTLPVTAEQLQAGAAAVVITTDIPGDQTVLPTRLFRAPRMTLECAVASTATRVAVQWMGVGVVPALPLPAAPLELPAWEPGIPLTGSVRAADNTPVAHQILDIGNRPEGVRRVTTDADGRFTLLGAVPGPLLIVLPDPRKPGGWTITVPAVGPAEVTLTAGHRAGIEELGVGGVGHAWWVPAKGAPRRMAVVGPGAFTFDPLDGEGAVWLLAGGNTAPRLIPYTPAGGVRKQRDLDRARDPRSEPWQPDGPSLGIILPMSARMNATVTVTLTGQRARAGCQVVLEGLAGASCSLLGKALYQIGSVPPGDYTVTVLTEDGLYSAPVTITAAGGAVEFTTPPAAK